MVGGLPVIADDKFPTVSTIFNLLNDWRHLPFYSLETSVEPLLHAGFQAHSDAFGLTSSESDHNLATRFDIALGAQHRE